MKYLYSLLIAGVLCAQTPTSTQPTTQLPEHKDAIIVTGTYEPIPLDEADRAVIQVPVRSQSLLFQNVVDALKLDPSVDLQQRAPGGTQADLSIRGSSNGQTLILINGMRVNDVQTEHHNLNLTTPLDEVQSVEILRGAGLDPSVITGGELRVLQDEGMWGNAWAGSGPLGIEADESDGSLVRYRPAVGVVMNLQKDHK